MAKSQKKGAGGRRKIGRSIEKCKKYRAMHTREMNKVRRVLRSSGLLAARNYAIANNVAGYLSSISSK